MKRLVVVVILLCVFIPVNAKATAFVYKIKETYTGIYTEDGGSTWEAYKENNTGYLIVEPGDNNTASVWNINIRKDPNGTKQKYYQQRDTMIFEFLQILVGNKTMWIMTYASDEENFMLSGAAKPAKIGTVTPKPTVATAITGTSIGFYEEDPSTSDFGSAKISLSLDTYLTIYGYANSGEDTLAYVIDYLETTLHYLPW
jgi:hypothetical protein